jgi:UDP-glucose:(heptosyl)LPS alpha-1,3-glucosyltransferase
MALLMVTDWWDEAGGGRERYLAELRTSLTRRGRTITVLTKRELGARRLRDGINRFRQSHPASAVLSAGPTLGATHYQLHSGVHAAAYAAEGEAFDSALRRLCAAPALRLNLRRQQLLRTEERMFDAGSGTKLMVFSAHSRDELHRRFGVSRDRVALARPGVDLDTFQPPSATAAGPGRSSRPGEVRLLFAGHNFVLKGLRWALEAQAQARRQGIDARLVVAGRGPIGSFSALADRLNLAPHVQFAGAVSRDALARLYRDSDLLMHPTFYDPFPRVIVEALASGVPVVTTAACGGSELITPGQNGFVVGDPRQVAALTDAIAAVADPDRRAAMGAVAANTGRCLDFESHADTVAAWLAAT